MKKTAACLFFVVFVWVCFAAPLSLTVTRGNLKLVLHGDTGSFSLYYLTDRRAQTYTPLLSDYNNSSNTGFYLQQENKIFDLKPGAQVAVVLEETPSGAKLHYAVKKIAEVTVDFIFLSATEGRPEDALKVEISVTNLQNTSRLFAFKGVFDTVLGERDEKHFSTLLKPLVNTETAFTDLSADKWVLSTNETASVLFLFDGANVTIPHGVALAGRDRLLSNSWEPRLTAGRSFSQPYALNDSALQVIWRQVRLSPGNTGVMRFYITAAANGQKPVYTLKDAQQSQERNRAGVYTDSTGTEVSIAVLSDNQLDPEYIASLLRRIDELEKNPAGINPDEIKRLNAELDAILERLRR